MDPASIQSTMDTVFATQESAEFSPERYALLFKPGSYQVNGRVGFYTQVSGLGQNPGDATSRGAWMRMPSGAMPTPPVILAFR